MAGHHQAVSSKKSDLKEREVVSTMEQLKLKGSPSLEGQSVCTGEECKKIWGAG